MPIGFKAIQKQPTVAEVRQEAAEGMRRLQTSDFTHDWFAVVRSGYDIMLSPVYEECDLPFLHKVAKDIEEFIDARIEP